MNLSLMVSTLESPESRLSPTHRSDRFLRLVILTLIATLFAGCAQHPEQPSTLSYSPPADWEVRRAELYSLTSWQINGKIGIQQPDQSNSAIINRWQQIENNFIIELSSTILGMGATQLIGSPQLLQIKDSDGETVTSDSPETLLQQQLGWTLPLDYLPYWIKGTPSPGFTQPISFTSNGDPGNFSEKGWDIEASRHSNYTDYRLPGKIRLSKNGIKIILIINQWQPAIR